MESKDRLPLEKLQNLSEMELTIKILIPLFSALGYEKIDYHGGPYEEGKDLIFWRYDELTLVELAVAQIKKYKPTAKAADSRSFSEVVNQLQCAFEKKVPHSDGKMYYPAIVYLITPFAIETRVLRSRFEKFVELRKNRLKVIDGPLLLSLIKKHLPDLAKNFFGLRHSIKKISSENLNNKILLNALNCNSEKNITSLYSDLDITFGNISAHFIFSKLQIQSPSKLKLKEKEWAYLREVCQRSKEKADLNLIKSNADEIDRIFMLKKQSYMTSHKGGNIEAKEIPIEIEVEIDIDSIQKYLMNKRDWIVENIYLLNDVSTNIEKCRTILADCYKIFSLLDSIFNDRNIKRILNLFTFEKAINLTSSPVRVKIPITKLFNTGFNFVILGEAGAGKTTCLQMHARNCLSIGSDRIILFLPLAAIIYTYRSSDLFNENFSPIEHLKFAIIEYYRIEGTKLTINDLNELLEKSATILLLDGIDEVINTATWIFDAIKSIDEHYPKSQVICSSRTGGKYLSEIPFLGINLLPFTDEQRLHFISNWFKSNDDVKKEEIISHLENNTKLSEIVRSPLLSTILCVLTEHGIALPESEIHLYDERIRLLLGHYDLHKKVNRITSSHILLNSLIRKIAFSFHERKIRELDFEKLVQLAISIAPKRSSQKDVSIALNELIYPCNILVPMSNRNSFGFGHFRYQEHLVALELVNNRGINISQYLTQEWWRGCLTIFAQLTDDINFLILQAVEKKIVTESQSTIISILNNRNDEEQKKYIPLIKNALKDEDHTRRTSSQR